LPSGSGVVLAEKVRSKAGSGMSIEIWKDESVLEQLVNKIRLLESELVIAKRDRDQAMSGMVAAEIRENELIDKMRVGL
jgi:hypothetical protein